MAMRQICHAGQMLLGLTDILARKEGAFGFFFGRPARI